MALMAKADYGAKGGDEHGVGVPVEDVGGDGGEGEGYAYDVEPEGSADGGSWDAVSAEAELEEEGGQADGGYYDQGEGAVEGAVAGVDDDQGQGEEEQGRGEDGPAAWWGRRGRLGSGVWQGVPLPMVIQGEGGVFKRLVMGRGRTDWRGKDAYGSSHRHDRSRRFVRSLRELSLSSG